LCPRICQTCVNFSGDSQTIQDDEKGWINKGETK